MIIRLSASIMLTAFFCLLVSAQEVTQSSAIYEQRDNPVTIHDLQILQRSQVLLRDKTIWHQKDNRECPHEATKLSLFCALYKVSVETLGHYNHRRVAMQEVRFAIMDIADGAKFQHRLMDFNNRGKTTFEDIHAVLSKAAEVVEKRLNDSISTLHTSARENLQLADWDKTSKVLIKMQNIDPQHRHTANIKSNMHWRRGEQADAIVAYLEVPAENLTDYEFAKLAQYLSGIGMVDLAANYWPKEQLAYSLALRGKKAEALAALDMTSRPDKKYGTLPTLRVLGEYGKVREILELHENSPQSTLLKGLGSCNWGLMLDSEVASYADRCDAYLKGERQKGNKATWVDYMAIKLHIHRGEMAKALPIMQRLVDRNLANSSWWLNASYQRLQDLPQAQELLQKAKEHRGAEREKVLHRIKNKEAFNSAQQTFAAWEKAINSCDWERFAFMDHTEITAYVNDTLHKMTPAKNQEQQTDRNKVCAEGAKHNFSAKLINAEFIGDVMVATAELKNDGTLGDGTKMDIHAIITAVFINSDGKWINKYEHLHSIKD